MNGKNGKKLRGRPWPKGTSGNPGGRPRKNQALSELLRVELDKPGSANKTKGQLLAAKLVDLGLAGDVRAIREIFDRVLGKPPQTMTFGPTFDPNVLDPIPAGTEEEVAARVRAILGDPGGPDLLREPKSMKRIQA